MKKAIAAALMTSLLLAACAEKTPAETVTCPAEETETSAAQETSVPQTEAAPETTSAETTVTTAALPPASLTFYDAAADADTVFGDDTAAELEKLTGVTLEIILPTGNVYDELAVMSESGTLPDLIFGGDAFADIADAGMLVPLDDYLGGSQLEGLYGEDIEKLRHTDGKIYTAGTGGALNENTDLSGIFQVQNRVLEEAGYPELRTLDDLERVIKDYLEAHPTNPNGTKNYGMLLCGAPMTQWHITVGGRASMVLGYPDDGDFLIDPGTGEAVYKFTDDRVKQYYKWLNRLYNEGIIADDSFSLKYGEYKMKISDGNVLALADNTDDFAEAQRSLYNQNLGDRMYFPAAPVLDDTISDAVLRSSGFGGEQGIGISRDCADPARAFAFLDRYCADDVQLLVNRGIEGTDFLVRGSMVTQLNDAGSGFVYPFPMAGTGAADSRGIYIMPRVPDREYTLTEQKTLEGYGITCISELFTPAFMQPVKRYGNIADYGISEESEIGVIQSGLEVYVRTEVTNAIKLPEGEFDAKWDEIRDYIRNAGGDMLSAMMTDEVKKRLHK